MIINWVGNFQNGLVGEQGDSVHLCRELEVLGHIVQRVPQDIWKAYCDGERNPDWNIKLPIEADINIITKWHHFVDGSYIVKLREMSSAPVFYWVWDYMEDNGIQPWHVLMAKCADLYLTNEYGIHELYRKHEIKPYYFPFDVCDGSIPTHTEEDKKIDVVFLGSCIGQGHRIEWLTEINKQVHVTCFSWNYEDWIKRGFEAYPAVYGEEFNKIVGQSKIVIGFSVNPNCWGYWSNRVGKVLRAGGFLLYEYAPGMELATGDVLEYFSSPQEAVDKIHYFLERPGEMITRRNRSIRLGAHFTSAYRVKQLTILIERYLKDHSEWSY